MGSRIHSVFCILLTIYTVMSEGNVDGRDDLGRVIVKRECHHDEGGDEKQCHSCITIRLKCDVYSYFFVCCILTNQKRW